MWVSQKAYDRLMMENARLAGQLAEARKPFEEAVQKEMAFTRGQLAELQRTLNLRNEEIKMLRDVFAAITGGDAKQEQQTGQRHYYTPTGIRFAGNW